MTARMEAAQGVGFLLINALRQYCTPAFFLRIQVSTPNTCLILYWSQDCTPAVPEYAKTAFKALLQQFYGNRAFGGTVDFENYISQSASLES